MEEISILGATGHIGKNLTYWLGRAGYRIRCYVRNPQKMRRFIVEQGLKELSVGVYDIADFDRAEHEVIVNCVGIGKNRVEDLFELTERYDNQIIGYLKRNKKCKYVNLSSGAVYGNHFEQPADENTDTILNCNQLGLEHHTTVIKLNAEAKHRVHGELNIVDLRLFAFFSRFIDLTDHYFMSGLAGAIVEGKVFTTTRKAFVRDYIAPEDLAEAVKKVIEMPWMNGAIDLYSRKRISKEEILALCREEYGVRIEYSEEVEINNPSGEKTNYYSVNTENIAGWAPEASSEEAIRHEMEQLIRTWT